MLRSAYVSPPCIAWYSSYRLLDTQMPAKQLAHLTLFCLADRDCADIPNGLNLTGIFENLIDQFPDVLPTNVYFTTPDSLLPGLFDWPASFSQVEYTHTIMSLYVGFNAAWAVTCIIAIGKWKE